MSETPEHDGLDDLDFTTGPVDLTPLLLRQFTWDTADHDGDTVNKVLAALGLPPAAPDSEDDDHEQSDDRMSFALPLEPLLHAYAVILGRVMSVAMTQAKGVTLGEDEALLYASQTAEVTLAGSRAIIAHLITQGALRYGPAIAGMPALVVLADDDDE